MGDSAAAGAIGLRQALVARPEQQTCFSEIFEMEQPLFSLRVGDDGAGRKDVTDIDASDG